MNQDIKNLLESSNSTYQINLSILKIIYKFIDTNFPFITYQLFKEESKQEVYILINHIIFNRIEIINTNTLAIYPREQVDFENNILYLPIKINLLDDDLEYKFNKILSYKNKKDIFIFYE